MPRKTALKGISKHPRRRASFLATLEVAACATALGESCEREIGISAASLSQVLARLAAAIDAGKCDGAYAGERP
jgi:hypothetical protein